VAETATAQVRAAVQAALAPAARYVALVVRNNPLGTAAQLLARPDIDATLAEALAEAHAAVADLVEQAWFTTGAAADATYRHLMDDVARQYASLSHLRALIRQAHAAAQPDGRPAAVRDAILAFARQVSLRSRLTAVVAEQAARAAVTLADGHARLAAGEKVRKRWLAREGACRWCRNLHGVTIAMGESFLPHLGGPADLSGHGHLTQPPRPYRGELQGPPLHPQCRCRLMVVTEAGPGPAVRREPAPPGREALFTAAQIRAMPDQRYRALIAFLRAAVHELGQVLRRLVSAV
jgi:hypothetical protein